MSLPEIDTSLFLFLNMQLQNGLFDAVMPLLTKNVELAFLPFIIWAFLKEKRKVFINVFVAMLAVALADGSGLMLKNYFARIRPCHTLEGINLLVGCGKSFSMPSNHASNAFAFAVTFLLFRRNAVSYALLAGAAAVGFSRIYVGVHYPSDVAAGSLVGISAAAVSVVFYKWAENIYRERSYSQALALLLILVSMFRIYYILTGPLDLSPDEAHYWEWSRRLDWSYYSKGPMIAYLIHAGTAVFGNTVFGIRILAVVLSVLSSLLLFRLGRELYDERTGFAAALLVQIVPLYSVYGILLTIDSPFLFFWALSLYFFYQLIKRGSHEESRRSFDYYWIVLGVSAGLGMLTKYTMAFFYVSAFLFMLFDRESRRFFASAGPYAGFFISMIVFSPVLLWNAARGWVTVKHTAGQAHIAEGFVLSGRSFFEFLGSQLGVVTPLLFVLIGIALWKLRKDRNGMFLLCFSVPVIAFFVLKSIQGKVQANWALTGYAAGFLAFSAFYIRGLETAGRARQALVSSALLLSLVVTVFAHFPHLLNLPPKMDPTMRLAGWKSLGKEAGNIYDEMSGQGPVFVFSDKYQVSSELAFYMKGNPTTYYVNLGRRMNQYQLWPGFEGFLGHNAIYVTTGDKMLSDDLGKAFAGCERRLFDAQSRKRTVKFTIFKCYDFRGIEMRPVETF